MENPTRELSKRVLTGVSFENRFIGYTLGSHSGFQPVTNYTFNELVELLKARLPLVRLEYLEKWIREVMGDEELADEILNISKTTPIYINQIGEVRNVMEKRLEQCRKAELNRINALIETV